MHLVYYHLHFLGHVTRGLAKLPQTFSLSSIMHVSIHSVAD